MEISKAKLGYRTEPPIAEESKLLLKKENRIERREKRQELGTKNQGEKIECQAEPAIAEKSKPLQTSK